MGREGQPPHELEAAIVAAYAATFIPRFDRYPVQLASTGKYIQVAKPLTLDLVAAHLENRTTSGRPCPTIGAYALDEYSFAKWLCFDADTEPQWDNLLLMAANLSAEGVTPYLEPSRRGGHLWLFTSPLAAVDARRFGKYLKAEYSLEKIELYPKQDQLAEGAGSFVRLPLGVHQKDGKRHHFVTVDGITPLAPTIREQVAMLAQPQRVPAQFIDSILAIAPPAERVSPTPKFAQLKGASGEKLSDRLKSRVSVYDFVSQYVQLDSRGIGFCPFHDDEHHSFQVNIQKNYWNCYATNSGCGGGSIIHFWQKWRELHGQSPDFKETVTELAQMLL